MDRSTGSPIATRTRSQQSTTEQMTSHEISPTERQEIKEDFSKVEVDSDEVYLQQQGNDMQQVEDNTHSSSSISRLEKYEMKNEQLNTSSNVTSQMHHLQETFAMELAQKQKIIEEQHQVLLQLQLDIQELSNGKHNSPIP